MSGLDPTLGFIVKTATEIKQELDADLKATWGASLGTNPDGSIPDASAIGQLEVVLVDGLSALWDQLGLIVTAFDPNQASGRFLDSLCSLTGTVRDDAGPSRVAVVCIGVAGTVLPSTAASKRVLTVTGTGARFDSQASATIASVSAWANSTAYAVGDLVTNDGGKLYYCRSAGTSAAGPATGPAGTGSNIIGDGTVVWAYAGTGSAAVVVSYASEVDGAIGADVGTLVNIATPVSGWTGAYNPLAATLGTAVQSDASLRVQRAAQLAGQGVSTPDAIRAKMLAIDGVIACRVFQNVEDGPATVESVTMPGHSVEVLVDATAATDGADNDVVALAVWRAVGAGIKTSGNVGPIIVVDAGGHEQEVYFSRPEDKPMRIRASIRYDANVWSGATADDDVKNAVTAALLNWGYLYPIGVDLRATPVSTAIMRGPYAVDATGTAIVPAPDGSPAVPGIVEVRNFDDDDGTLPWIGKTADGAPTTSTTVALTARQRATFDAADIDLVASSEAP